MMVQQSGQDMEGKTMLHAPVLHLRIGGGLLGWHTLKHNHPVRKVCRHDEIVLNDKRRLLRMQDKPETQATDITHNKSTPLKHTSYTSHT